MVASTMAGALGGILMKLSHTVLGPSDSLITLTPDEKRRRRRVSWLYFLAGAVVCQAVLNVGLSAAALACAAQSLLSPLVSCQIVFNAFLSPCLLGERLTRRDILGTALIVIGCTISGFVAPKEKQRYSLDELIGNFHHAPFEIYLCVMALLVVGTFVGARAPSQLARRVCAPALPGAFVGNANIFAKGAAGLVEEGFRTHSAAALGHPLSYAILFFAFTLPLGSLYFLNKALAQFEASMVVPIYISTLIVVSTVSGGIYFGEIQQMDTASALGLAAGVGLVVVGVCVQASAEQPGGGGANASPPPTHLDGVVTDVLPLPGVRSSTNGSGMSTPARTSNVSLDAPLLSASGGYEPFDASAGQGAPSGPRHVRACSLDRDSANALTNAPQ